MNGQECNHCIVASGDSEIVDDPLRVFWRSTIKDSWISHAFDKIHRIFGLQLSLDFLFVCFFFSSFCERATWSCISRKRLPSLVSLSSNKCKQKRLRGGKGRKSKCSLLFCCHLASELTAESSMSISFVKGYFSKRYFEDVDI